MRTIGIITASFALVIILAAPAQATTTSSVSSAAAVPTYVVPGTRGTVFWYSTVLINNRAYTAGNIRWSWTAMWALKNHYGKVSTFAGIACGGLRNATAAASCAAIMYAQYLYIDYRVNLAVAHRRCLTMRFPLPPLVGLTAFRVTEVRCTA